jgi:hypothetical protein
VPYFEIWAYVASEGFGSNRQATATRLLAKITGACDRLLKFPLSGAPRVQLAPDFTVALVAGDAVPNAGPPWA